MKITNMGTDLVVVNEENYDCLAYKKIKRIHIIKLDFKRPTFELVEKVMNMYYKTNRFVIENNVREYNNILRRTEKKYYVVNKKGIDIISFFRKNNKILLNFMNLTKEEQNFFLIDKVFNDILRNVEVIAINKKIYDEKMRVLDAYNGNVIVVKEEQKI